MHGDRFGPDHIIYQGAIQTSIHPNAFWFRYNSYHLGSLHWNQRQPTGHYPGFSGRDLFKLQYDPSLARSQTLWDAPGGLSHQFPCPCIVAQYF